MFKLRTRFHSILIKDSGTRDECMTPKKHLCMQQSTVGCMYVQTSPPYMALHQPLSSSCNLDAHHFTIILNLRANIDYATWMRDPHGSSTTSQCSRPPVQWATAMYDLPRKRTFDTSCNT